MKSIQHKIILIMVVIILAFGLIMQFLILPAIEDSIYEEKKNQVKNQVEATLNMMDYYYQLVEEGTLSTAEAKKRVKGIIKNSTYGPKEREYFWLQNHAPKMIMHPFRPDLNGTMLGDIEDEDGVELFTKMVKKVENGQGGFVEYKWQYYDNKQRIEPKVSYVGNFGPWNWIVGTGVYINDIQTRINMLRNKILIGLLIIIIFMVVVAYYMERSIVEPILQAQDFAQKIAKGKFDISNLEVETKDEIGILAKDLNDMRERLSESLEQVEYLAFHDELTELYNRRYFEKEKKRLNTERQLPISIIIGDIDNLKDINDTYGHQKGDEYISKAAAIFAEVTREEDIVARIGGDEFAILLSKTDNDTAQEICKRYYKNLKEYNINTQLPKDLSVSLGYATKEKNKESLADVFEAADNNMYLNKSN